jgi:chromosome segregation protein
MFLERLEIQGFKSFANKTILDFSRGKVSQGITAVVGPNGTGKSNVVDAIRWVLGEQSLKILRGKKANDVIFFGTKKRIPLGLAEASLYFNNDDKAADLDYNQIVITRRVFRDGEGEYLINKAKVRLQDVLLFLAKANFGQRTYGIIGQGMVDSILNSSHTERQEFFSEAVNIKQYQLKREQSLNKLARTEENLSQAELLIKEIEPRLKTLTRQIKRLEKREALETQLRNFQINFYSSFWQKIKTKLTEIEKQIREKKAEEEEAEKKMTAITRQLENLRKRKSRSENFSQLQKQLEMLSEKKNLILQEKIAIQNQIPTSEKQDEKELIWLEKKLKNLDSEIEKFKDEKEQLESQVKNPEKEQEVNQNLITQIDSQIDDLNQKLATSSPSPRRDFKTIWLEFKNIVKGLTIKQETLIKQLKEEKEALDLVFIRDLAEKIKAEFKMLLENLKQIKPDSQEGENLTSQLARLFEEKKVVVEKLINARFNIELIEKKLSFLREKTKNDENERELTLTQINLLRERFFFKNKPVEKNQPEIAQLGKELSRLETELDETKNKLSSFNKEEEERQDEVFALQEKIQAEQNSLDKIRESLSEVKINLAKIETHREDLEKEIVAELGALDKLIAKTKSESEEEELRTEIERLKRQLEIIGGLDKETVSEYKQTKERYEFLTNQSVDLREAMSSLENIIEELDNLIKKQFESAFTKINEQFNKYFRILFGGGSARLVKRTQKEKETLELIEEVTETKKSIAQKYDRTKEILIEIEATPPGKKIKSISMLSGGERALTALALLCAIIANNSSPFIVLDEVDAALDEANSRRFAKILEDLSIRTQIITITHNRATMEIAQQLYGLTMNEEGISKLVSLKLEEAKKT